MLHLALTRSKNIAEAVNSRTSLGRPPIKRTGRSKRSKFRFALLQESAIKMLVAIAIVSLIASGYSLPLEEALSPQTIVQDTVKPAEVQQASVPYPGPPSGNLPFAGSLPQQYRSSNIQVLPENVPQVSEYDLSQPEGVSQVDGAENPPLAEGGNQQEDTDLKTDASYWGYGGGWGYRRPYYGWGGYYSNPYRRWGHYGYGGRGYGGGWGRGYGGGWGWGGGYGGYWG